MGLAARAGRVNAKNRKFIIGSALVAIGIHLAVGEAIGAFVHEMHSALCAYRGRHSLGVAAGAAGGIGGGAAKVFGSLSPARIAVGGAATESGFHHQAPALLL